jgi:hypothetical protein
MLCFALECANDERLVATDASFDLICLRLALRITACRGMILSCGDE